MPNWLVALGRFLRTALRPIGRVGGLLSTLIGFSFLGAAGAVGRYVHPQSSAPHANWLWTGIGALAGLCLLLALAGSRLSLEQMRREEVRVRVEPQEPSPAGPAAGTVQVCLTVFNDGPSGRFTAHVIEVTGGLPPGFPYVPYGGFDLQWVDIEGEEAVIAAGNWRALRLAVVDVGPFLFQFTPPGLIGAPFNPHGVVEVDVEVRDVGRDVGCRRHLQIDFEPGDKWPMKPVVTVP